MEEIKEYMKQYRKKNKDKIKEYRKQYNEKNKDKIKQYNEKNKDKIKKYREENKDKIKKYRENNKDKMKKYRKENKDKIKIKEKKWRENNKDKIKIKKKKYKENNKDKIKIGNRKYYENNKKAICIICGKPAFDKFCSEKCMGIGTTGENGLNWKGGKSFNPYPITWTERFKRQIRKRDAYLCMMCGRHQDEFNRSHCVHHIDGNPQNTVKKNCITLCLRHHMIVERSGKVQTFWMAKFQKMLSKVYRYK